ncbi:MAG: hypothetical protein M3N09_07175, partial [Actinomycetota bacterium]|nr:hypothetical protein [Actinomycetota bacterium]
MENTDLTIRPGRREDAAQAARLWMQCFYYDTSNYEIYTTSVGAERVMRRFLTDLAGSSHAFLFVAEYEGRTIG